MKNRRLFLVMVLLIASLCLTGTVEAKTTIRIVKGPGANYNQATDPDQLIINEFNKLHPDVEVILEPMPDYVAKLLVNFTAGVFPDVLIVDPAMIAQFKPMGILEELSSFATSNPDLFTALFPLASTSVETWGGLYAIPTKVSPNALYYNVDEFAQAGLSSPNELHAADNWNWSTFLDAAKKLTIDTSGDGEPNKYGYKGSPRNWPFFVWQNHGTVFSADGTEFVMDRAAQEAIQFASDLINVHRVWTIKAPYYTTAFAQGLAAMIIRDSGHVNVFRNDAEVNWDTAMVFGRQPGMPFQEKFNLGGIAICAESQHKEVAWELIQFFLDYEAQILYAQAGQIPINRRAAMSSYVLDPTKSPRNMDVFLKAIEVGLPNTDPAIPSNVNAALEKQLNAIWNRGEPVQMVLDGARPAISALLAEYTE